MKKIYMTMVALLCGAAAMAQTANLDVTTETIEAPQGGEASFVVGLTCNQPSLAAVSFRVALPEGCDFTTHEEEGWDDVKEEETIEIVFDETNWELNAARMNGHSVFMQYVKDEQVVKNVQVGISAIPAALFKGKEGDIITLKFPVADDAPEGEYTIKLYKAAASTKSGKSVALEDVEIPFKITKGTGINSVNAENSNAPIYNLAGQRVSKAQKGIFIQNGKKTIK